MLDCTHLPIPPSKDATPQRQYVTKALNGTTDAKFNFFSPEFLTCDAEESSPVIIFVSKLAVMDKTTLPQHQSRCGA